MRIIPYGEHGSLRKDDTLVVRNRNNTERHVPPHKWWINRNTPVGEDAELWERMPHSGRRAIEFKSIVAVIRSNTVGGEP